MNKTPNKWITSPAARRYLYIVGVAVAAVLVGYGLLTPDQSHLWLDLLNALLGGGLVLAAVNTPTNTHRKDDDARD